MNPAIPTRHSATDLCDVRSPAGRARATCGVQDNAARRTPHAARSARSVQDNAARRTPHAARSARGVQDNAARRTPHAARSARSAFTILELLLVLVILAVLAGIVGSRFVGQSQSAKIKAATTQLQNFKLALGRYEIDMGRYPSSSEGLRVLVERPSGQNTKAWQGPYLDGDAVPKDQWENAWNYRQPGQHIPEGFDLWSNGPDGTEGGSDDIANWTK